jgi:hypothetical protein
MPSQVKAVKPKFSHKEAQKVEISRNRSGFLCFFVAETLSINGDAELL